MYRKLLKAKYDIDTSHLDLEDLFARYNNHIFYVLFGTWFDSAVRCRYTEELKELYMLTHVSQFYNYSTNQVNFTITNLFKSIRLIQIKLEKIEHKNNVRIFKQKLRRENIKLQKALKRQQLKIDKELKVQELKRLEEVRLEKQRQENREYRELSMELTRDYFRYEYEPAEAQTYESCMDHSYIDNYRLVYI